MSTRHNLTDEELATIGERSECATMMYGGELHTVIRGSDDLGALYHQAVQDRARLLETIASDRTEIERLSLALAQQEQLDNYGVVAARQSAFQEAAEMSAGANVSDDRETELLARITILEAALTKCQERFEEYVRLHLAKGTAESGSKAASNQEMADLCEAALSPSPVSGSPTCAKTAQVQLPHTCRVLLRQDEGGPPEAPALHQDRHGPGGVLSMTFPPDDRG